MLETSPPPPTIAGATPVGLAEIRLGSLVVGERVRLPVDLLRRVGAALDGHSLDLVLTRLRLDLPDPDRRDDEARLDRRIDLPATRSFALTGVARVRADAPAPARLDEDRCRDDLLTVDGTPLPVRLVAAGGAFEVTGCAPVTLAGRSHRLLAAPGSVTGVDVDQLVLCSGADGEPSPVASRGTPGDGGTTVRVVDDAATHLRVEATSDGRPFWLVLGQSDNDGWTASADGAEVGERQQVDGYANGWLITPDGTGTFTVRLRWGPQRLVWVGFAASAITLAAVGLLLWRSRRSPQAVEPPLAADPAPMWATTWAAPLRVPVVLACTAAIGLGALVVASPGAAALSASATIVAGLLPRGRLVLVAAAPVALLVSRLDLRPSLAWVAVALLAADLLLEARSVAWGHPRRALSQPRRLRSCTTVPRGRSWSR